MENRFVQKSIFSRVHKVLEEKGSVPEDFCLEEKGKDDNEIRFAPGALEGILGHHSSGKGEDAGKLALFLKKHFNENPGEVVRLYEEEWKQQRTATIRDEILKEIIDHRESYDAGKIMELAYTMMVEGTKIETVKMGLTLMALFDVSENEQIKRVLLTLGCCEDFTEYVLVNISDWPGEEQNQVYFEFAKKLRGWGKIEAVERLEADTDEIKEWILCEGCKNSILYDYLGLICAEKCDFLERLRVGGLKEEEWKGASDIMEGLLGEGPCLGISALEGAEETIYWYLCESSKKKMEVESLRQVLDIRDYLEDGGKNKRESYGGEEENAEGEWKEKALCKLTEILNNVDEKAVILQGLKDKKYNAVYTARALKIDISGELFDLMQTDFETYYRYGDYFLEPIETGEDRYRMALRYIRLCENHLDYAHLPTGMGNCRAFELDMHWNVDMVVQYLDRYPGEGQELIRVSLHAPVIRWRNMAARALEAWKEHYGKKVEEFAPELYQDVLEVAKQECDERLKERFRALLDV